MSSLSAASGRDGAHSRIARRTDSVDGNVRAAPGPAPGPAARALPRVVGPGLCPSILSERTFPSSRILRRRLSTMFST